MTVKCLWLNSTCIKIFPTVLYLFCWCMPRLQLLKILSNIHLTAWQVKGTTNLFSLHQMEIRNVSIVHNETISINLAFYYITSAYKIRRVISNTSSHEVYPVGSLIQITDSEGSSHTSVSITDLVGAVTLVSNCIYIML